MLPAPPPAPLAPLVKAAVQLTPSSATKPAVTIALRTGLGPLLLTTMV
jgi:hypothetical protein